MSTNASTSTTGTNGAKAEGASASESATPPHAPPEKSRVLCMRYADDPEFFDQVGALVAYYTLTQEEEYTPQDALRRAIERELDAALDEPISLTRNGALLLGRLIMRLAMGMER